MGARLGEVVGGIGLTNVAPVTPYESFVDNTVTSPEQNLFIKIPSIDQGRTKKGPCRWTPMIGPGGLIYPTKDDVALSVRSQEGFYWVQSFIPAIYPAIPPVTVGPIVSTLPASPVDKQVAHYQNAAMATLGLVWTFRWRAGSASGFKWEFIGGSPWTELIQTSEQRSNAAYGHLATVGPQIAIPLTGEYLIAWGARIQSAVGVGGGAEGFAGLAVNSVAFGGAYYVGFVASAQFNGGSSSSETNPVALTNAQTLQIMYATQAAITFAFNNRWLRIIPVRVS